MKTLSIQQPWANWIINQEKKYEFRTWKTNYRGPFFIHASKGIDKEMKKWLENDDKEYPKGAIIGIAYLEDCIPITPELEAQNPKVYGHTKGRTGYAWKLSLVKKLEQPIPIKGKLGLFEVEDSIISMHTNPNKSI